MESDPLVSSRNNASRRPYHYTHTLFDSNSLASASANASASTDAEKANYSRYLYYNRLRRTNPDPEDDILLIPSHVIPPDFFYPTFLVSADGKQSSIVTIFALWNTMMGTAMLSMPWAIEQAGFIPAIFLLTGMAALAFYMAYRILQVFESHQSSTVTDLAILCKKLLGRWAQIIAVGFSALTLLGAAAVYWVLMSNFLYHSVDVVRTAIIDGGIFSSNESSVFCPNESMNLSMDVGDDVRNNGIFNEVWKLHRTVPLFLILVLGPISCIRSPTFFTKFNSLGTLAVAYLIVFVGAKWMNYGINLNFSDPLSPAYVPLFKHTFPALEGMLSLAYFIHNCLVNIMRNNRIQENNKRDLGLAFIFVALTYILIGGSFFVVFPLDKSCIQENFLDNFHSFDLWVLGARIFLFFQMLTVFPLIVYILRAQVIYAMTKKEPSMLQTIFSNIIIIAVCVSFAIWLPKVGTITRFTGAICGLVYLFFLPVALYIVWQRNLGTLKSLTLGIHLILLALGVLNCILQFAI